MNTEPKNIIWTRSYLNKRYYTFFYPFGSCKVFQDLDLTILKPCHTWWFVHVTRLATVLISTHVKHRHMVEEQDRLLSMRILCI